MTWIDDVLQPLIEDRRLCSLNALDSKDGTLRDTERVP